MDAFYVRLKEKARQIAERLPPSGFYFDFVPEIELTHRLFEADRMISRLRRFIQGDLENDMGHGVVHSVKVALDAGALAIIESRQRHYPENQARRLALLALCAGLLHDTKRKEKDHAAKGAAYSQSVLESYPLTRAEIDIIALAIHNHQAFKPTIDAPTPQGQLVSDCLYDADKFRWGPDNFTDTVWEMVSFHHTPVKTFVAVYPRAIERVIAISTTFRTPTGQIYGPPMIDTGLAIGDALYALIRRKFSGGV